MTNNIYNDINILEIIENNKLDPSLLQINGFDVLFRIPDIQTYNTLRNGVVFNPNFKNYFITNIPTFRSESATYPLLAAVVNTGKAVSIIPNIFHYFNQEIKKNEDVIEYYESICEKINNYLSSTSNNKEG